MKLIDILLENITPEQWPTKYLFAAQDKYSTIVYFYEKKPGVNKEGKCFYLADSSGGMRLTKDLPMGKKWSKNIVNRDEFVERYNKEVKDWITWEGDSIPPVAVGTRVDVQYRNGLYNYHVTAGIRALDGSIPDKCATDWDITQNEYDIIRYRVCPLTAEEKLTKIKELGKV